MVDFNKELKKTKALVPEVMEKETQLAERIEVPDWLATDAETDGTENIGRDDVKMPRLAIAQGLSPQMLRNKTEYIDGLKLGEMFNSLTSEIYGEGPIEFVVVRRDNPRWVEFDEDRNMVDPDVPPNDRRTEWRVIDGERKPPIATQFYDYVIVLLDSMQPIALSCARTNIPAAKILNGFIKMPKIIPGSNGKPFPIYAVKYTAKIIMESNDKGTFGIFQFKQAGNLLSDLPKLSAARGYHLQFKDKIINIDREVSEDIGQHPDAQVDTAGEPIPF